MEFYVLSSIGAPINEVGVLRHTDRFTSQHLSCLSGFFYLDFLL